MIYDVHHTMEKDILIELVFYQKFFLDYNIAELWGSANLPMPKCPNPLKMTRYLSLSTPLLNYGQHVLFL